MNTSKEIAKLIDACLDDERMLEHESRFVSPERARVLRVLAAERGRFIDELRGVGGIRDTREHGSWRELGRELSRDLRVALGLGNGGDAIAACRRSCKRTEARFERALDLPWPTPSRAVIEGQHARIHATRDELSAVEF